MGKGDMRTRKGKIYRGSHGRTRPRKKARPAVAGSGKPTRRATRKK